MTDHAAVIREKRAVAHRAVTEGVNVKYIDILRRACYDACDIADALVAERDKWRQAYEDCHWCEKEQAKLTEIAEAERDAALKERDEWKLEADRRGRRTDATERYWHVRKDADRYKAALGTVLKHSLLNIRAAAFGPEIGVRYTEAIRSSIEQEIRRLEDFIREALRAAGDKPKDPDRMTVTIPEDAAQHTRADSERGNP